MKKIIYTFCITFLCSMQFVLAQNVNIPDAAFKAILVGDPNINTNNDGEIQVSEAEAYTGGIGDGIGRVSDATGIEAFININYVEFDLCNISSLDLSHNIQLGGIRISDCQITNLNLPATSLLTYLYCWQVPLTSIDISKNPALTNFYCGLTNVTSIDVSHNPALTFFNCYGNTLLTSLNLKNGHNAQLTGLYATNNPNLTCIQVDDPAYMDAHWSSGKDVGASFSTNCGTDPIVNIPDANFKAALVGNNSINTNGDGEIQVSEAEAFSDYMDVSNQGITDLTGIAAFKNLLGLTCSNNALTSLNLASNTALTWLDCNSNQLTNLDVSHNTQLNTLLCRFNQLTNLDVSNNSLLSTLGCSYNQITALNVSQNLQLLTLVCSSNNIESLDCSNNIALSFFDCSNNKLSQLNVKNGNNANLTYFDAQLNASLTCIQVDDASYMSTNWNNWKDATANYSTNCGSCNVYNASFAIATGSSSNICSGGSTNIAVNISSASATSSYFDVHYTTGGSGTTTRYVVTGPDVSIPITVSPAATATYTLADVTDAFGCTAIIQDTFATVTVNPLILFFRDADGDGYGDAATAIESCEQPAGYVTDNTDCNDNDNTIFPGAPELCDGKDNNCNGQTDEGCTANISINDVSVKEGNKGQKTLKFTVSLSAASAKRVKVNYATQDGTAIAPGDYIAQSGTLIFKPGKVTATVSILINGDRIGEPDESFSVVLTNANNAGITKATGTGTILNDDKTNFAATSISANVSTETKAVVMPNPANSFVNVQVKGFSGLVTVSLMNVQGKTVQQQKQQTGKTFSNQLQLNVSSLTAGLYILVITDEKGNRSTEKLIVQH